MWRIVKFILLAIFIEIALSPIRGLVNLELCVFVGFGTYFLLYILIVHRTILSADNLFYSLMIGILIIQMPLRISSFNNTLLSFPDFMFHILGVVAGYLFINYRNYRRWWSISAVGLLVVMTIYMSTIGYAHWMNFVNYGLESRAVIEPTSIRFNGVDESGTKVENDDFLGKVVLLDFWFTECRPCIESFPNLQEIQDRHKDNKKIQILAVNTPIKNDSPNTSFELLKRGGYTFLNVVLDKRINPAKFGVQVYPTTIVLNRQGDMVYRGNLAGAEKFMLTLIQK